MTRDRWIPIREVAESLGRSVDHVRQVAEVKAGLFMRKKFTDRMLASYPKFTRGPGKHWGAMESDLQRWRDAR